MMDRWLGTMLDAVHYVHSQSDDFKCGGVCWQKEGGVPLDSSEYVISEDKSYG